MAKIVFTKEVQKDIAGQTDPLDALQLRVAMLIGEVQWRRFALPGGEDVLKGEGEIEGLIELYRSIADGQEPARSRVVFDPEQERQIRDEVENLPVWEQRPRRLHYELEALFGEAERATAELTAERIARTRSYPPKRHERIQEILAKLRDQMEPENETLKMLELAIYRTNHDGLEHSIVVLRAEPSPDGAIPESEAPYIVHVEEDHWHLFAEEEQPKDSPLVIHKTKCGQRFEDLNGTAEARMLSVVHMSTAERDEATTCSECLGLDAEVPKGQLAPSLWGWKIEDAQSEKVDA